MSDLTSLKQRLPVVLQSADTIFGTGDYTSATILYFKTWFLALDILLLEKEGKSPKDHIERFKMLKSAFPDQYQVLDDYYPIYRHTYTSIITQRTCTEVKTNVQKLIAAFRL